MCRFLVGLAAACEVASGAGSVKYSLPLESIVTSFGPLNDFPSKFDAMTSIFSRLQIGSCHTWVVMLGIRAFTGDQAALTVEKQSVRAVGIRPKDAMLPC